MAYQAVTHSTKIPRKKQSHQTDMCVAVKVNPQKIKPDVLTFLTRQFCEFRSLWMMPIECR